MSKHDYKHAEGPAILKLDKSKVRHRIIGMSIIQSLSPLTPSPSPPKTYSLGLASFRGRGEPDGAREPVVSATCNVAISGVYPKSFCRWCFAVDKEPFDWLDEVAELSLHP